MYLLLVIMVGLYYTKYIYKETKYVSTKKISTSNNVEIPIKEI